MIIHHVWLILASCFPNCHPSGYTPCFPNCAPGPAQVDTNQPVLQQTGAGALGAAALIALGAWLFGIARRAGGRK